MAECPRCKFVTDDEGARYCSRCASPLEPSGAPAAKDAAALKKRNRRFLFIIMVPIQIGIAAAAYFFVGGGCSSVTGSLVSTGAPLGDFTFTPTQCRSGQRMQFFGAALLGGGQTDGAVVAIIDPIKGKQVKVEIPGSCKPPDYEVCREVIIDPAACTKYDITVSRTGVVVNDIVLVKGRLGLECAFPGGGSVKADMTFERCN